MSVLRFDSEQDYQRFLTNYQGRKKRPREAHSATVSPKSEDKAVVLLRAIVEAGVPGVWYREFMFHEARNWRLDVACPEVKIGVEVSGQVHRIKDKFARDREKRNALIFASWRVLEVTPAQVVNGEALALLMALVREKK